MGLGIKSSFFLVYSSTLKFSILFFFFFPQKVNADMLNK